MTGPASTMLKAAGLWRKTSRKEREYFIGRLGGVKAIIFQNGERNGENEPSHYLFFADGKKSRDAGYAVAPARESAFGGGPPRRHWSRAPYLRRRLAQPPIRPDDTGAMFDDRLDDIGRPS
jgi:hypothetical protein